MDLCPSCGKPHPPVLLIPVIIWSPVQNTFVRRWKHGSKPSLN